MADTPQVVYEYSDGNSISFFTNNLRISYRRHLLRVEIRPDGTMYVVDPDVVQRIFTCTVTGYLGDDLNTLNTHYVGGIDYSGAYPRLAAVYLDTDTTLTNVEVALTQLDAQDEGGGTWTLTLRFEEKTTGNT